MIHFYDSASPENIPSGVHAAVAINGDFAWKARDVHRMAAIFAYSVLEEPDWARFARGIDVENGAAKPVNVVPFVNARRNLGFNDATAYVNRSNWEEVKFLVEKARIEHPFYWVSTLDGTQDIAGAWAVQYFGGEHAVYDLSVLHGVYNLHRP